MSMNRAEKTAEIENLKSQLANSQLTILTDYKGLSVASVTDLRRKLRAKSSVFKVVKNRLARIAVKDTTHAVVADHFKGTTAVATSISDLTGPAKVITDFLKDNEILKFKTAVLNGKVLDFNQIKALASLPSKEELVAKMLGSLNAPATNLVSVLSQIPRQLVTVLSAIRDQKEQAA